MEDGPGCEDFFTPYEPSRTERLIACGILLLVVIAPLFFH